MATDAIRYIQCGLGPIGCGIVRAAAEQPGLQLVGAVDVAAGKMGRDVAEIAGLDQPTGVTVCGSIHDAPPAEVILHSTASHLPQIGPQLRQFIDAGLNCISTAEELTWPWLRAPEVADELDALAKEKGVRLLGSGINPGFVLDLLPMLLTVPCRQVDRVVARRVVDTGTRRPQLQAKTGITLTEREYRERAARGAIGHVGLPESVALLAAGLGWSWDDVSETIEPVIAEHPADTHHFSVREGHVLGGRQVAVAMEDSDERIRLELEMYAGAPDPHDEVVIEGKPSFRVRIDGGIPGDEATPACVINAIPSVLAAPPGLLTAKDIVVPRWQTKFT